MATRASIQSPWLKASQARAYLQIDNAMLTQLLNTGTIPSVRRGNTRFVHTADLDAWMRSLPSGASPVSKALQSS